MNEQQAIEIAERFSCGKMDADKHTQWKFGSDGLTAFANEVAKLGAVKALREAKNRCGSSTAQAGTEWGDGYIAAMEDVCIGLEIFVSALEEKKL